MSDTNVVIGDEPPAVQQAIQTLLRQIPDRWSEFHLDQLTTAESRALFLLVAAGMVERRIRMRVRCLNDPLVFEIQIRVTGEYGLVEALERFWGRAWEAWGAGWAKDQIDGVPNRWLSHCEFVEPMWWRLTTQGCEAREDLAAGEDVLVLNFVLRRGFFQSRPAVRGEGVMESFSETSTAEAKPVDANVVNWAEGAEVLAQLLQTKFAKQFQSEAIAGEDEGGYAKPGDSIPDQFYTEKGPNRRPNGPLEGNQTELAWAVDPRPGREPRDRQLKKLHGKRVWVEITTSKLCHVYFQNPRDLEKARNHLAEYQANAEIWKVPRSH